MPLVIGHIRDRADINFAFMTQDLATKQMHIENLSARAAALYEKHKEEKYLEIFNTLATERKRVSLPSINEQLDFCKFHGGNPDLFDIATSHLIGSHYRDIFQDKNSVTRYLAAFSNQEEKLQGMDAGGCQHEVLLAIRARVLLEWLFSLQPYDGNKRLLEDELLHTLETLAFYKNLTRIPYDKNKNKMSFSPATLNLAHKLCTLINNEEYTLPTGWKGHAVCITFVCKNDSIVIRIDNLDCQTEAKATIQPTIIGSFKIANIEENYEYLESIINHARHLTEKSEAEGMQNIYRNPLLKKSADVPLSPKQMPACKPQASNNCFVQSFLPGLISRVGEGLANKLNKREKKYLTSLKNQKQISALDLKKCAELYETYYKQKASAALSLKK